jgi:hypothetical protein
MRSTLAFPLLIASLLLPLSAHAVGNPASFSDPLAEFAKPYARSLSREINVYHWTELHHVVHAPDKSPLLAIDQRARDYAYFVKQTFWNADYRPAGDIDLGAGFYVAIDPVVTRSFGGEGDKWALIQTVIPAGARFLAIEKEGVFPTALKLAAQQANCPIASLKELFAKAHVGDCRAARDKLIAQLDLTSVRYRYKAQAFTACATRPPFAFVIFDDRALRLDRMVSFTSDLPEHDDPQSENRRLIEALWETGPKKPLWPKLKGAKPASGLGPWMRDNLLGCGTFAEDAAVSALPPKR